MSSRKTLTAPSVICLNKEYSQIHLLPYSRAAQSEDRTGMTVTKT